MSIFVYLRDGLMVKESILEGIERRKRFIELLIIVAGLVLSYGVSLPVKDGSSFKTFLCFLMFSIFLFHIVSNEIINTSDKLFVNCVAIGVSLTFALYMVTVMVNNEGLSFVDLMYLDGKIFWIFLLKLRILMFVLALTVVVFLPLCFW